MGARVLLAGAVMAAAFSTNAAAQPEGVARAQAVYAAQCAACHAPAPGAPLGDLTRRAPASYEAFARAVRSGEGPTGEMPAFDTEMVSEPELRALYDHIARLRARR